MDQYAGVRSDDQQALLLPSTEGYKLYWQRFWILGVFGLQSFGQCMFWLTFSPVANNAEEYYNISEAQVDLLLNWGPIVYIPVLPLTSWLLSRKGGLRTAVVCNQIMVTLGMSLRILPNLIPSLLPHAIWFLHVGHFLNGAAGPVVMAAASLLSAQWFGSDERSRATTVAVLANNLGAAAGFLIGPYMVKEPHDIPNFLYMHAIFAWVTMICIGIYFPAAPPTPPSAAQATKWAADAAAIASPVHASHKHHISRNGHLVDPSSVNPEVILVPSLSHNNEPSFIAGCIQLLKNPSFMLLSLSGGLSQGFWNTWTGVLLTILSPMGYSQNEAGWFGFIAAMGTIVGGLVFGSLMDRPSLRRRFKLVVIILSVTSALFLVWFILSLPSIFDDEPLLPSSLGVLGTAITLGGVAMGGANPLYYELGAELTYPVPEVTSASFITLWNNVIGLIFLFLAPELDEKVTNFALIVALAIFVLMLGGVREQYKRRAHEDDTTVKHLITVG